MAKVSGEGAEFLRRYRMDQPSKPSGSCIADIRESQSYSASQVAPTHPFKYTSTRHIYVRPAAARRATSGKFMPTTRLICNSKVDEKRRKPSNMSTIPSCQELAFPLLVSTAAILRAGGHEAQNSSEGSAPSGNGRYGTEAVPISCRGVFFSPFASETASVSTANSGRKPLLRHVFSCTYVQGCNFALA
jgi:hypothetical protein